MELIVFVLAVFFCAAFLYLFACIFYFAFTSRSVGLALNLSWKLSLATMVGIPVLGFGSIVFAALVLHDALAKTANYSKVRDIIASFLIATAISAITLFLIFALAWEVFD